jgi:uridine kinase
MFIIGITGGTASGKTTIVKKLTANFNSNDICVISQDSYYKRTYNLTIEERINQNFDHPDALDLHLLQFHLETLKSNHSIEMPI